MFPPLNPDLLRETRGNLSSKGYAVVSNLFDAAEITAEVDWAIATGCKTGFRLKNEELNVTASYVPMATYETPTSLSLLLSGAALAAQLLGRAVIPFRAKGTVYSLETSWHVDTELDISSLGLLAYLDPLDADTGALRVEPGSHRGPRTLALDGDRIAEVLFTRPGDIILLDERTRHASSGGRIRRQWRADYVAVPEYRGEEDALKAYVAEIFSPGWDGGYDVDRFPSFGAGLLEAVDRRAFDALERSGALAAAKEEEDFVRSL